MLDKVFITAIYATRKYAAWWDDSWHAVNQIPKVRHTRNGCKFTNQPENCREIAANSISSGRSYTRDVLNEFIALLSSKSSIIDKLNIKIHFNSNKVVKVQYRLLQFFVEWNIRCITRIDLYYVSWPYNFLVF